MRKKFKIIQMVNKKHRSVQFPCHISSQWEIANQNHYETASVWVMTDCSKT